MELVVEFEPPAYPSGLWREWMDRGFRAPDGQIYLHAKHLLLAFGLQTVAKLAPVHQEPLLREFQQFVEADPGLFIHEEPYITIEAVERWSKRHSDSLLEQHCHNVREHVRHLPTAARAVLN